MLGRTLICTSCLTGLANQISITSVMSKSCNSSPSRPMSPPSWSLIQTCSLPIMPSPPLITMASLRLLLTSLSDAPPSPVAVTCRSINVHPLPGVCGAYEASRQTPMSHSKLKANWARCATSSSLLYKSLISRSFAVLDA